MLTSSVGTAKPDHLQNRTRAHSSCSFTLAEPLWDFYSKSKQSFTDDGQRLAASNKMVLDCPICPIILGPIPLHSLSLQMAWDMDCTRRQWTTLSLSGHFHMFVQLQMSTSLCRHFFFSLEWCWCYFYQPLVFLHSADRWSKDSVTQVDNSSLRDCKQNKSWQYQRRLALSRGLEDLLIIIQLHPSTRRTGGPAWHSTTPAFFF